MKYKVWLRRRGWVIVSELTVLHMVDSGWDIARIERVTD